MHLHPTNLIAVPVPEEWHSFWKDIGNILWYIDHQNNVRKSRNISLLNLTIIGTVTKDNIDFDTETHMPNYIKGCDDDYVDFEDNMNCYNDADNSFRSLLSANEVYFENPCDDPNELKDLGLYDHNPNDDMEWDKEQFLKDFTLWQTAQSKVNKKYVILQKI